MLKLKIVNLFGDKLKKIKEKSKKIKVRQIKTLTACPPK